MILEKLGLVAFVTTTSFLATAGRFETFSVALIVAGTGIGSPLLLAFFQGRQRRAEKKEDYAREDQVALHVKEANERASKERLEGLNLSKVIHTLVNSQMTAAMKSQLDALQTSAALLKEMGARNLKEGVEPSKESTALIARTEGKISDLQAKIADREEHDAASQMQQKIASDTAVARVVEATK